MRGRRTVGGGAQLAACFLKDAEGAQLLGADRVFDGNWLRIREFKHCITLRIKLMKMATLGTTVYLSRVLLCFWDTESKSSMISRFIEACFKTLIAGFLRSRIQNKISVRNI